MYTVIVVVEQHEVTDGCDNSVNHVPEGLLKLLEAADLRPVLIDGIVTLARLRHCLSMAGDSGGLGWSGLSGSLPGEEHASAGGHRSSRLMEGETYDDRLCLRLCDIHPAGPTARVQEY